MSDFTKLTTGPQAPETTAVSIDTEKSISTLNTGGGHGQQMPSSSRDPNPNAPAIASAPAEGKGKEPEADEEMPSIHSGNDDDMNIDDEEEKRLTPPLPETSHNVTYRKKNKKASNRMYQKHNWTDQELLDRELNRLVRKARLNVVDQVGNNVDDTQHDILWGEYWEEAEERYEYGEEGTTPTEKLMDQIMDKHHELTRVKNRDDGDIALEYEQTRKNLSKEAEKLRQTVKRKERDFDDVQQENLRLIQENRNHQMKIHMLESGNEPLPPRVGNARVEGTPQRIEPTQQQKRVDTPYPARPSRKSWIRDDPDEEDFQFAPRREETKFRKPVSYTGTKYTGGTNFDSHNDEVRRDLANHARMDTQQERAFYYSSLTEVFQRFARYGYPADKLPSIEQMIENIREFHPNARQSSYDRFVSIRRELDEKALRNGDPWVYVSELMDLFSRFQNMEPSEPETVSFGNDLKRNLMSQTQPLKRSIGRLEGEWERYPERAPVPVKRFTAMCKQLFTEFPNDEELAATNKKPTHSKAAASTSQETGRVKRQRRDPADTPLCRDDPDCTNTACRYRHQGPAGEERDRQRAIRRAEKQKQHHQRGVERGYIDDDSKRLKSHGTRVENANRNAQRPVTNKTNNLCYRGKECARPACPFQHPAKESKE